jgi:hypothetical protein
MDALRREAAVLRALLLAGPVITIPLMLMIVSAFLLGGVQDEKRVEMSLSCMLFAVVCLVARAATRVRTYCASAGPLGVPDHAVVMRRAQCILIGLVTLVPIAFAYWIGGDFRAVVVFVAGAAFGIYLSETLMLALIVAFSLNGLDKAGIDVWPYVFGIPGSAAILLASAWGIARWLRLPGRLETAAAATSHSLADPGHESQDAAEVDAADVAFESHLEDVLAPGNPLLLTPRRLWIGLSYDPRGSGWRALATGFLVALVALVILHFWKHARWDTGAYLAISGLVALNVFGRFGAMTEAWLRTHGEQSILVLSARWPSRKEFKLVLLRSVWSGIPGLLGGWMAFSAATLATGWISWESVLLAALIHAAVIVSSLGLFLSYFARSRVRTTNLVQMGYLLIAVGGTATLLISVANGSVTGTVVGAGLLLAPAAAALLAFFLRPALFPVQRVARK